MMPPFGNLRGQILRGDFSRCADALRDLGRRDGGRCPRLENQAKDDPLPHYDHRRNQSAAG